MNQRLAQALAASTFLTLLAACQTATSTTPRLETRDPMHSHPQIPGYAHGSPQLMTSPITPQELELLQQTLLFGPDDVAALRTSLPLLEPQIEAILDVWYGFVGSTPQLVRYFADRETGAPDAAYLAAVRTRFGQWIKDTARAEYDQEWLDYQHEIGLRHHSLRKNRTDGVDAAPIIHFRYLVALTVPVTTTLRPFLEKGDHTPQEVDRMHAAWCKSVLMQVILWSHPYVRDDEF